jgi:hypothetical protein
MRAVSLTHARLQRGGRYGAGSSPSRTIAMIGPPRWSGRRRAHPDADVGQERLEQRRDDARAHVEEEPHLDGHAVRARERARLDADDRLPALAQHHLEAHGLDVARRERPQREVHRHVGDEVALLERDLARLRAGRLAARGARAVVDAEAHHSLAVARQHARVLPDGAKASLVARDRLERRLEGVPGRAVDDGLGAQGDEAVVVPFVAHHVHADRLAVAVVDHAAKGAERVGEEEREAALRVREGRDEEEPGGEGAAAEHARILPLRYRAA